MTGASSRSFGGWVGRWMSSTWETAFRSRAVAQRATALAILSAVPGGCPIVLDGLAFGALPEAGALRFRTPHVIALVHQPLALESGLDTAQAARCSARASAPRWPLPRASSSRARQPDGS